MTPVHVIGGFLGAGKTTTVVALLRKLSARGERVAVIVNDFGTARIDEDVIAATGLAKVAEIHGACVCCTAPDGLVHDLRTLLDEVAPTRVIIEPTGLGRPADIVDTLRRGPLKDRVFVGPVVVVVDASAVDHEEPLVRDQVESADVVVMNKADLASITALTSARSWVCSFWPQAERLVEATHGDVDPDVLLTPVAAPKAQLSGLQKSTEGWFTVSSSWPGTFSHARLLATLEGLPPAIVRVKGLFRTDEGTFLVEKAGGAVHVRPSGRRIDSRCDVIGTGGIKPTVDAIGACQLTEAERALARDAVTVVDGDCVVSFDRARFAALSGGIADVGAVVPKRRGRAASLAAVFEAVGEIAGEVPDKAQITVIAHDGLATEPVKARDVRKGWLVFEADGGPLPDAEGGPVRLLVPGATNSCSNVKGVARIVVRRVT